MRTNQLNTTGRTYSYDELDAYRTSPDHLLLVARLTDRYGPYGNIGLALVETGEQWRVKVLLMSCRVMSRGVGTVLINHLKRRARDAGAPLHADFVPTSRNRMMLVSFKFNGFKEVGRDGDLRRRSGPDPRRPRAPAGRRRAVIIPCLRVGRL
ncbi:hypothetical protein [Actinokineospora pegani]|uniref:hypothetical protein n=1 Tax=Actinokineospora pegani TaxID=2654637 RepID=UPI001F3FD452|nr:hypothetical protein [Actinokineospora pegani]